MKASLILIISLSFSLIAFGQVDSLGFTNKAEAKNLMLNGIKEGKWVEYYPTFQYLVSDSEYHHNHYDTMISGSDTGIFTFANPILTIYKNGKQVGTQREYNRNGTLYVKTEYSNGKKEGIERMYFEHGNVWVETPYINGEINGAAKCYYPSGKILYETQFTKGKLNGIASEYYEDGKLKAETTWDNGVKGVTKTYDENGNEIK